MHAPQINVLPMIPCFGGRLHRESRDGLHFETHGHRIPRYNRDILNPPALRDSVRMTFQ